MVFYYIPRKRAAEHQVINNGASITDLPDELLLEILKHLDTDSVTKFRLTCSTLTAAGNTELQSRLKTLYIHSTAPSLRRAVGICEHPLLSRDIEEIVLLGKSVEDHQEWLRSSHSSTHCAVVACSMVWPKSFPVSMRGSVPSSATGISNADFATAYAPLMQALNGLRKLRKLSFQREVTKPGFNQVAKQKIKTHARPEWARNSTSIVMINMIKHLEPTRLCDRDFFFGIFCSLDLALPELEASLCLPTLTSVPSQTPSPWPAATPPWSTLKAVTIGLAPRDGFADWDWEWLHILRSAEKLERLAISVPAPRPPYLDTNLSRLFMDLPALKCLRSLELTCNLGAEQRRPSCQYFDLIECLQIHRPSLARVKIRNVLFNHHNGLVESTEDLLEALSKLELAVFEWTVNRLECGDNCRRKARFRCAAYNTDNDATTSEFDELCDELGIGLDEDTKAWDFGGYVMRQKHQGGDKRQ